MASLVSTWLLYRMTLLKNHYATINENGLEQQEHSIEVWKHILTLNLQQSTRHFSRLKTHNKIPTTRFQTIASSFGLLNKTHNVQVLEPANNNTIQTFKLTWISIQGVREEER